MKLTPQLHVVLKISSPEATACTVPYACRVWALMKLKNKVISSPFLTDSERNQDPFFSRGGMLGIICSFQHTCTRSEKCR